MFDDLHYAAGERVEADVTVRISFGMSGVNHRSVELDLSEVHAKELDDLLSPYLNAGQQAEPIKAPAPNRLPPRPPGHAGQWNANAAYNLGMREWADAQGINYRNESTGQVYYSRTLRDAYAEYLINKR
jgi:hypothetical protein